MGLASHPGLPLYTHIIVPWPLPLVTAMLKKPHMSPVAYLWVSVLLVVKSLSLGDGIGILGFIIYYSLFPFFKQVIGGVRPASKLPHIFAPLYPIM